MSLWKILPCVHCRNNFIQNLKDCNFNVHMFNSRYTFSHFIYTLHNQVNKMLGTTFSDTYDQVRTTYECFRSRCNSNSTKSTSPSPLEKGCTTAYYGKKAKCALYILPRNDQEKNNRAMWVHPDCKVQVTTQPKTTKKTSMLVIPHQSHEEI